MPDPIAKQVLCQVQSKKGSGERWEGERKEATLFLSFYWMGYFSMQHLCLYYCGVIWVPLNNNRTARGHCGSVSRRWAMISGLRVSAHGSSALTLIGTPVFVVCIWLCPLLPFFLLTCSTSI